MAAEFESLLHSDLHLALEGVPFEPCQRLPAVPWGPIPQDYLPLGPTLAATGAVSMGVAALLALSNLEPDDAGERSTLSDDAIAFVETDPTVPPAAAPPGPRVKVKVKNAPRPPPSGAAAGEPAGESDRVGVSSGRVHQPPRSVGKRDLPPMAEGGGATGEGGARGPGATRGARGSLWAAPSGPGHEDDVGEDLAQVPAPGASAERRGRSGSDSKRDLFLLLHGAQMKAGYSGAVPAHVMAAFKKDLLDRWPTQATRRSSGDWDLQSRGQEIVVLRETDGTLIHITRQGETGAIVEVGAVKGGTPGVNSQAQALRIASGLLGGS